jgi:hypothetical protein
MLWHIRVPISLERGSIARASHSWQNATKQNQYDDGDKDPKDNSGGELSWLVTASGHVSTRQAIESIMSL